MTQVKTDTFTDKENTMSRKISAAAATMMAASLLVSAAYAHAELKSAEPAAGAVTATPPQQIKITFNENVIPQFSGIEVKDQTGRVIATGKAAIDPANRKLLVVPVDEQLPVGEYKVEWHAAGEDTHRVKGSFSFGVAR